MNTNMHTDKTVAGRTNDGNGQRRSLWKSPAIITALILLILLLCDHFVDGWNWPLRAFVMVGALIFGIGFTYGFQRNQPIDSALFKTRHNTFYAELGIRVNFVHSFFPKPVDASIVATRTVAFA